MFVDFCGINTSTKANQAISVMSQNWEEVQVVGSHKPEQANTSTPLQINCFTVK